MDELQSLLDEAAGLMGYPGTWRPTTLDSILAAFQEALPGWEIDRSTMFFRTNQRGTMNGAEVRLTGHTVAAWRLDLARLLVQALKARSKG